MNGVAVAIEFMKSFQFAFVYVSVAFSWHVSRRRIELKCVGWRLLARKKLTSKNDRLDGIVACVLINWILYLINDRQKFTKCVGILFSKLPYCQLP